jgi:hypothetical protein
MRCSDWVLAHRHPCGVDFVNLLWVASELFTLQAVLSYLRETGTESAFFSYIDSTCVGKIEGGGGGEGGASATGTGVSRVTSVEDLCELFAKYQAEESVQSSKEQPTPTDIDIEAKASKTINSNSIRTSKSSNNNNSSSSSVLIPLNCIPALSIVVPTVDPTVASAAPTELPPASARKRTRTEAKMTA